MDFAAVLLILFVLVLLGFPIWAFVAIRALQAEVRLLTERVARLTNELLVSSARAQPPPVVASANEPTPSAPALAVPLPAVPEPESTATPTTSPPPAPLAEPPPLPASPSPAAALPPPILAPTPPPTARRPVVNLEHFVGAKLFAWLGGLTAFLAVAFFVKYSFEHDLIPAEVRVAIGFVLSAGLIVTGLRITSERYRITSQVLCATGVVSLYAVTFACNAVYRFAPFTPLTTFALMTLITATAFLLAVRMNAQVVALLGLLGGFLTPILVSTGRDNPLGLFSYIALLDAGLIAVALHRRWYYLIALAAGGTLLMQLAWLGKFFTAPRAALAATIALSFSVLFALAAEFGRRIGRASPHTAWSAAAMPLFGIGLAFYFLSFPSISARPGLLLGLVFAADALVLLLAWRDTFAARAHLISGAVVFAFLAVWTTTRLDNALLPWALAAYLVFAGMHTAFPLLLQRTRPGAAAGWSQAFPPLALVLMLIPLLKLDDVPLLFWPAVLVIDALAVGLALLAGSLMGLAIVLVLTLATAGVVILQASTSAPVPPSLLIVVGVFAVFFFAAGLLLSRRLRETTTAASRHRLFGDPSAQIPSFGALLPFILLVMMVQRLSPADPAPLFGLALLLCVLVLGLSRLLVLEWLPACALAGLAALEFSWHTRFFEMDRAIPALLWYGGFHLLFAAFPVVFRRSFATSTGPWAVAALIGAVQFPLVYNTVSRAWPNDFMGLLPALFALIPLALLLVVLRLPDPNRENRLGQLAWTGGLALLFITLIFPIQFERQWITVAWALEGAALLWLFQRVPHPGLRLTGVVLLVIAFVRLALNRAIFSYRVRGDTPIFNWYLYAFGIAIASLLIGARLLRSTLEDPASPTSNPRWRVRAPALLETLAVILTFLLLNIEIADYFTPAGRTLTFEFSGNFARDMAYTIGWALFALALLGAGIWRRARAARIAAISLLGVTLLKLFLHDLAELNQLYRVGALIAVAAVAILASFLYQRFAPQNESPPPA